MKKMRKYKWILFMVLILCLTLTVLGGSRSKDDQYIHVGTSNTFLWSVRFMYFRNLIYPIIFLKLLFVVHEKENLL